MCHGVYVMLCVCDAVCVCAMVCVLVRMCVLMCFVCLTAVLGVGNALCLWLRSGSADPNCPDRTDREEMYVAMSLTFDSFNSERCGLSGGRGINTEENDKLKNNLYINS